MAELFLALRYGTTRALFPGEQSTERSFGRDFLPAPPITTSRLHPLKGNRKGVWGVTVRSNWRLIFRFEGGDAYDVTEVYH